MKGTQADVAGVRVVRVTRDGKAGGFGALGHALAQLTPAGFVAVDTEFSGLGSDERLSDDNLATRYAALRELADKRAVLSIGLSVFNPAVAASDGGGCGPELSSDEDDDGDDVRAAYNVANFDLLMRCESPYEITADAGEFLVAHGFDFNRMFEHGIPYVRASTEKVAKDGAESGALPFRWGPMPRGLLWRIGRMGVPLVLHNGLYDLVFLYAAFHGALPETLSQFVSALMDCVPAGYWDTKLLAEGAGGERASFLSYVFAKRVVAGDVRVQNSSGLPSDELTDPVVPPAARAAGVLCEMFSFRGFCPRATRCQFSHDPFLAVEQEEKGNTAADVKEARKRHNAQVKDLKIAKSKGLQNSVKLNKKEKRRRQRAHLAGQNGAADGDADRDANGSAGTGASPAVKHTRDGNPVEGSHGEVKDEENQMHSAGYDAFCTGFCFASYRASLPAERMAQERNRINLNKKKSPLLLCKSSFADLDLEAPKSLETGDAPSSPNKDGVPMSV